MKALNGLLVVFLFIGVVVCYTLPQTTMKGYLDMNSNKIIGLSAPSNDTDAATKGYADALTTSGMLPIVGGEMKGSIDFGSYVAWNGSSSVNDTDLAIKSDISSAISTHNTTQYNNIARYINTKSTKLFCDPSSDYIVAMSPSGSIIASSTTKAGNQAVIEAAFDSLNSTHYVIECFGDAAYLNDTVELPDKLIWHNNHLVYYPLTGYSHEISAAFKFDSLVSAKYGTVRMYDVVIDGGNKDRFVEGMNLSRVQNCYFENLYILHSHGHGLILHDDSWWNTFVNLQTYDNTEYGLKLTDGSNDKPNANNFYGGHISSDDGGGIWIDEGDGNTFDGTHIDSTGSAVYILGNQSTFKDGFIEACTNGFYVGDGSHTVDGLNLLHNRMFTVTNPRTFVAFTTNTLVNEGNTIDGDSMDVWYTWSTGTGSEQALSWPAVLVGSPYDVRCWYIGSGSSAVPAFYTNEATKTVNITADNGRLYRVVVKVSA